MLGLDIYTKTTGDCQGIMYVTSPLPFVSNIIIIMQEALTLILVRGPLESPIPFFITKNDGAQHSRFLNSLSSTYC